MQDTLQRALLAMHLLIETDGRFRLFTLKLAYLSQIKRLVLWKRESNCGFETCKRI